MSFSYSGLPGTGSTAADESNLLTVSSLVPSILDSPAIKVIKMMIVKLLIPSLVIKSSLIEFNILKIN